MLYDISRLRINAVKYSLKRFKYSQTILLCQEFCEIIVMKIVMIITIILFTYFLFKASGLREEKSRFEPLYYACKIYHFKNSLIFLAV